MRKALTLIVLLFALSTCGMCIAHLQVNAARDKVAFTERVLYGDKSAVQGLTAEVGTHYRRHLFWDTSYTVGEEDLTATEYAFSATEKYEDGPYEYRGVELGNSVEMGFDYDTGQPIGVVRAYKELLDSTWPGQENKKRIYLKDYYDYYPISGRLDLPGYSLGWSEGFATDTQYPEPGTDEHTILALMDFFKIPVLDTEQLDISVSKHTNGDLDSWGSGSSTECDSFYFWTQSALTPGACYFTFKSHTYDGETVDTSYIPGGYGIYCLPYETVASGLSRVSAAELSMVYPLNPEIEVETLGVNADGTKLLLHTREDGKYVLTVIDVATMSTLQRLEIFEWPPESGWYLYEGPDFLVAILNSSQLAVISQTDTGDYDVSFITDVTVEDSPISAYLMDTVTMAFDGQRLAVSGFLKNEVLDNDNDRFNLYGNCGFYLVVCDASGPVYYGEYDSSLTTAGKPNTYAYFNFRRNNNPIRLSWSE